MPRHDVLRFLVGLLCGAMINAGMSRRVRRRGRARCRSAWLTREVASGSDSIAAMEALVSAEMREKIDVCRYDVAEYLTKRGFAPFH
jgi:hypothetical protein